MTLICGRRGGHHPLEMFLRPGLSILFSPEGGLMDLPLRTSRPIAIEKATGPAAPPAI